MFSNKLSVRKKLLLYSRIIDDRWRTAEYVELWKTALPCKVSTDGLSGVRRQSELLKSGTCSWKNNLIVGWCPPMIKDPQVEKKKVCWTLCIKRIIKRFVARSRAFGRGRWHYGNVSTLVRWQRWCNTSHPSCIVVKIGGEGGKKGVFGGNREANLHIEVCMGLRVAKPGPHFS